MKKDSRVIWRVTKDAKGKVTAPGGSGVLLSDPVDGQAEVSVETESPGDGNTHTFDPAETRTMPVASLIEQ